MILAVLVSTSQKTAVHYNIQYYSRKFYHQVQSWYKKLGWFLCIYTRWGEEVHSPRPRPIHDLASIGGVVWLAQDDCGVHQFSNINIEALPPNDVRFDAITV